MRNASLVPILERAGVFLLSGKNNFDKLFYCNFIGGKYMYEKVSTSLNFAEREQETLKFWKENEIFKKSGKASPL